MSSQGKGKRTGFFFGVVLGALLFSATVGEAQTPANPAGGQSFEGILEEHLGRIPGGTGGAGDVVSIPESALNKSRRPEFTTPKKIGVPFGEALSHFQEDLTKIRKNFSTSETTEACSDLRYLDCVCVDPLFFIALAVGDTEDAQKHIEPVRSYRWPVQKIEVGRQPFLSEYIPEELYKFHYEVFESGVFKGYTSPIKRVGLDNRKYGVWAACAAYLKNPGEHPELAGVCNLAADNDPLNDWRRIDGIASDGMKNPDHGVLAKIASEQPYSRLFYNNAWDGNGRSMHYRVIPEPFAKASGRPDNDVESEESEWPTDCLEKQGNGASSNEVCPYNIHVQREQSIFSTDSVFNHFFARDLQFTYFWSKKVAPDFQKMFLMQYEDPTLCEKKYLEALQAPGGNPKDAMRALHKEYADFVNSFGSSHTGGKGSLVPPCLRHGIGKWIPFSIQTERLSEGQAGAASMVKAVRAGCVASRSSPLNEGGGPSQGNQQGGNNNKGAQGNSGGNNNTYEGNYSFDERFDRIQYIRGNNIESVSQYTCTEIEKPFAGYGNLNNEEREGMPITAIHWKRFKGCFLNHGGSFTLPGPDSPNCQNINYGEKDECRTDWNTDQEPIAETDFKFEAAGEMAAAQTAATAITGAISDIQGQLQSLIRNGGLGETFTEYEWSEEVEGNNELSRSRKSR